MWRIWIVAISFAAGLFAGSHLAIAQAPPVGSSCVGEVRPDGTLAPCNSSPAPEAPSATSSGPTPSQQMQLDAGYAAGQAIGNAFVKWLLSPPSASSTPAREDAQKKATQLEQQRLQEQERQRRESESAAFQQGHQQLVNELKGGSKGSLQLRQPGTEQTLEGLKNQVRAIDCAMAEVYQAAKALGPSKTEFVEGLRRQVLEAEKGLPRNDSGIADDTTVINVSRDSMADGVAGDTQLVTRTLVVRGHDTGQTHVDVLYSLVKAGKEIKAGQDNVILNSAGGVECLEVTKATAECMRRMNLASSTHDCPKSPSATASQRSAQKSGDLQLRNQ